VDQGEKKAESADADAAKAEEASEKEAEPEKELSPLERLQADLEELQEKARGKKKEYLTHLADFENNKKKSMKERESRRRNATANFARRMVEVYGEFQETFPEALEGKEEGSPVLALQEGVLMTRDVFRSTLERSNVERLEAEIGTPVVSARHEVVGSIQGDGSAPAKSIAEVVEAGWIMDMRSANPQVLRKAKVNTSAIVSYFTASSHRLHNLRFTPKLIEMWLLEMSVCQTTAC